MGIVCKARHLFSRGGLMGEDDDTMPPVNEKGSKPGKCRLVFALVLLACALPSCGASSECEKVVLQGEVNAGHAWNAPLGMGWVFRVIPIVPGKEKYSGWDLVMDRVPPAGFPDALFLATPPYNSINEREIGTTYELRAQDAIGWNPRTFSFIVSPAAFHLAQSLFLQLQKDGAFSRSALGTQQDATAMSRLLGLQKQSATGEFRIDDARLIPGAADPAPYAREWSQAGSQTPHQVEPSGPASGTPRGSLDWMRFTVTFWLPRGWKLPPGVHSTAATCP